MREPRRLYCRDEVLGARGDDRRPLAELPQQIELVDSRQLRSAAQADLTLIWPSPHLTHLAVGGNVR